MKPFALRARFVLPIERPPLAGGILTIAGGRIVSVGENRSGAPPLDLGDVALLPGFVNAHTHLEFSHLRAPLGQPGMALPDWLRLVIRDRREHPAERLSAVQDGLRQCTLQGVTTIGEISQSDAVASGPFMADPPRLPPVGGISFLELIGLDPGVQEQLLRLAQQHVAQPHGQNWQPGVSPHAPYTVRLEMVERIAGDRRLCGRLAMHLAESPQELELLAAQKGPFVELLRGIGAWHADAFSPGRRPLDYLRALARARRALVVHGNYLSDDEHELLAAHRDRLSVVYCPRTHAFFGHAAYPLEAMLDRGVRVALGTDSRASNPDLSLLEEMKLVRRLHTGLSSERILALGTIEGARALGWQDQAGSLAAGKPANLTAVAVDAHASGPYAAVLAAESNSIVGTWYRGERIV